MLPLWALTVIEQAVVGEESVAVAVSLPSVVSKSMRLPLTDMSDMDISLRPYTIILSKGCEFDMLNVALDAGMDRDIPVNPMAVVHGIRISLAAVKDDGEVM